MRRLDYTRALPRDRRTILKDNISWHLPYLSANSTPWQLEGVVRTLREDGYRDLLGLHNQTVVTDAHRGDKLNKFAGRLPPVRGADASTTSRPIAAG